MGLLYEAYTLPWDSAGFKKKFFWLPVEPGSGKGTVEFLTSSGESSVTVLLDKLAEANRDLTEIVSDTESSLIRVIDCLPDGTRTIIDEWVCERPARVHDDERKVTISGPKLKAKAFDSQTIPAFDSPANPSINPDHIWGGENILSDPGFENADKQNEEYEIDLDGAAGGSFVLHLNGNDTNSIPFDTSVGNLENEVESLPGITDVLTDDTGAGFRIEFHNPISPENEGLGLLTWTPSLTGTADNEESLERTNDGQILPSSSWTKSQHPDASTDPHIHGTYASDGYRLTEGAEPVRSGEYAGRINGLTQFAGIQQLVRVLPSTRHQASIWFWSSDATETFRLVMRDRYENLIAWANVTNSTPSTWTEVTLDFVTELADGTPITEMIFRFAQTQDHNPSPYYIDDAHLAPGAPASTWGEIVNVLMGLKTAEFDWIDHSTVTDSLDSGSVAWPRDESVTAFFGESFGQFWDKGVDLEYEWDLEPKATPLGSLTHDLVWYGPGGMDDVPSAGIYPNSSVTGGDSLTRTPAFTKVIVEGADGRYVEAEDAAAVAAFGELEKYVKDTSLHSDESLNARANGLLTYEAANRNAVHFQMVEHAVLPRPGTHFRPGDTIPMQLPPGLSKTSKRVQSFSYTNSFPTQYLVTGSRVLKGEAAAYSLLWRLWRRFENPFRDKGGGGFAAGGGGKAPTLVIAASDAPDSSKARADFTCPGTEDGPVIQAVIDIIQTATVGGRVLLTEGTYFITTGEINLGEDLWLQGMGSRTVIQTSDTSGVMISTGNECHISDLTIVGPGGTDTVIGIQGSATSHNWIDRVRFESMQTPINDPGDESYISDCISESTGEFLTADSQAEIRIIGNTNVRGITITSTGASVKGVQILDNFMEGQISLSDIDGFQISDNVWIDVVGGNPDIITLDTVTAGVINGNTTPNGAGYDIMDIASSSDIIIMSNIWDNVIGGIVSTGSSEILIDKNIINGVVDDSVDAASSNLAQFSQAGTLATGTGTFKLPFTLAAEIISVQLAVGTSPTGADLIVDVNKNGTTIFSTQANRPTVPAADADGVGAEATPDVTSIAEGDYLTVDIDQIGSTIAGEDLTVSIEWRPV